ncbi:hypothetical protein [Microbacterium faecale]|uniref:hypothetical protein n=1 Tax=Microbacterium faecale TaxID=1804630 RepID=UPI00166D23ED|nr:hypothetical protein [Microbacterium faecale]
MLWEIISRDARERDQREKFVDRVAIRRFQVVEDGERGGIRYRVRIVAMVRFHEPTRYRPRIEQILFTSSASRFRKRVGAFVPESTAPRSDDLALHVGEVGDAGQANEKIVDGHGVSVSRWSDIGERNLD